MNSNEVQSLNMFLDMIGGPEEYKGAVLVAALINTFKESLTTTYLVNKGPEGFTIHVEYGDHFTLDCSFQHTYLYLFM